MLSEQEFSHATARGQQTVQTGPVAVSAIYDRNTDLITIALDRGYAIQFPPARVQDLSQASPEDLTQIELTTKGLGLYFPRLDCDLWVPALAQGKFGSQAWEAEWLCTHPTPQAA